MTRFIRLAVGAFVAGAGFLAAAPAGAQTMCNDATVLPNPVIVAGSTAFEPTLRQLAAKLAAEASPYSIIYSTARDRLMHRACEYRERDRSGRNVGTLLHRRDRLRHGFLHIRGGPEGGRRYL